MAEGGGHVHVAIDIIADDLLAVHNKRNETATADPLPCIVRVPEILRELNTKAYVPEVVGLGPYHHHHLNPSFNIRSHKLKALDCALRRSLDAQGLEATDENVKGLLQQLRVYVSSFENEIKACYLEDFEFDADVFMLDAVFLLELCFSWSEGKTSDCFHPLLDYRTLDTCVGFSIKRDLCKLENQIPLPFLRELITWKGMFPHPGDKPCAFYFMLMTSLFPIKHGAGYLQQTMDDKPRPKHLIDCLHRCTVKYMRSSLLKFSNEDESDSSTRTCNSRFWKRCGEMCSVRKIKGKPDKEADCRLIPGANDLQRAGIVVQVSEDNQLRFEQERFGLRAHLYLPKLWIDDSSEVVLRNMMAYEEWCVEPGERFFNSYMSLMTDLIQTESDADLLIRQGIIENFLEKSESVAHLFNRLNMVVSGDKIPEIDDGIAKKVRVYYMNSFKLILREFTKAYFANPYCATIAAGVGLVCTLVQTFYAVK